LSSKVLQLQLQTVTVSEARGLIAKEGIVCIRVNIFIAGGGLVAHKTGWPIWCLQELPDGQLEPGPEIFEDVASCLMLLVSRNLVATFKVFCAQYQDVNNTQSTTAVQLDVIAFFIALRCIWSRCATTGNKSIIAVNEHNEPSCLSSFLFIWRHRPQQYDSQRGEETEIAGGKERKGRRERERRIKSNAEGGRRSEEDTVEIEEKVRSSMEQRDKEKECKREKTKVTEASEMSSLRA
ncbi:hypothetical protein ABVT39_019832, partial [Epinephelus coioides]